MVEVKTYAPPPVKREEIGRYGGMGVDEQTQALLDECLSEALPRLTYRVCWAVFPLATAAGALDLGFARTDSAALGRWFKDCDEVAVFAATVGLEFDRLLARYGRLSPAKALLLDAVGTERVESLCDVFCADLAAQAAEEGKETTRRFSPGYGDLPLSLQRDIFRVLDPARRIGLTLNDSLLMSPSKSVTALIGLRRR